MTSAEAARPTLPNIALKALYVACLLWLTEHRNTAADVIYTVHLLIQIDTNRLLMLLSVTYGRRFGCINQAVNVHDLLHNCYTIVY